MKDWEDIFVIWLKANKSAHSFIDENYWNSLLPTVREMIPNATVYGYKRDGKVVGFIGLEGEMIEGIFVNQSFQGKGIGSDLLAFVKEKSNKLKLSVYQENQNAFNFYLRKNFSVISESIDETGHVEYTMEWNK